MSPEQIIEAKDWVEEQAAGQALPEADTRQGRALERAICAYALALATGLTATTIRTTETAAALKRVKVEGDVEVEYFAQKDQADASVIGASEWLSRAYAALAAAGLAGRGWAFAGVSR